MGLTTDIVVKYHVCNFSDVEYKQSNQNSAKHQVLSEF